MNVTFLSSPGLGGVKSPWRRTDDEVNDRIGVTVDLRGARAALTMEEDAAVRVGSGDCHAVRDDEEVRLYKVRACDGCMLDLVQVSRAPGMNDRDMALEAAMHCVRSIVGGCIMATVEASACPVWNVRNRLLLAHVMANNHFHLPFRWPAKDSL